MALGVIEKGKNTSNVVLKGNRRLQQMKANLFKEKRQISIERALLYTESYQQTEGQSVIIRRAKAVAHILENVKISIREGELLVGNRTVRPRSGILSPEMDPYWILEEIDTIDARPQDQFKFMAADKKIYLEALYPYWKNRSMKDFIKTQITPDIQQALDDEIFKLNQTDKGQGHIIMDFPAILEHGIQYYIDLLKVKINTRPENDFFKAGLLIFEAMHNHFLRYSALAKELADAAVSDKRKKELEAIAEMCHKLSTQKPDTFYEALQLLWMTSVVGQYESNASSLSLGRMDQYLYPFYQQSLKNNTSADFLYEVLGDFYVKTNDVVLLRSESSAKCFAGFPTGYTVVLGGLDEFGRSSVNELSYMMLDLYHEILLPQPNLSVRMNELIPRKFLLKTCETIRLGTGIPQLFNDEVCVPAFLSKGVALKDARDYATVGCVEISIPGKTYGLHDIALFNLLRIMELSMYELKDKADLTYEALFGAIEASITRYVKLVVKGSDIVDLGHRHYAPTPFLSVLIADCLENGCDVTEGGARYNFSGVQGIGEANLSDSLFVIKKLVFEKHEMTFSELVDAMAVNYQGEYAKLQEHLIQDFDKYGNDNDEIDEIAMKIFHHFAMELDRYHNIRGGRFIPGAYTVSAHIPLGEAVGATPDGRKAHEQLADGGLSPMVGRDRLGPTAVLKSVSKLDNYLTVNGSLLNLKFQPNTLKGVTGLNKFADFLMAYTKLKIQHVQFNVQSKQTLLDAQKNPEKYTGLLVRVAGYSAFFVDLNKQIQDDIIARVEHEL
ncbi:MULTISPECIES: formate C-acetyltransferase [unclassified Enterococcus]|uniref:formate C-acetyltransferase n=1 Tax=unclassified Enterococcus TaxID=2608891 RepID=UPI001556DCE5|nr:MULTISPECIES: formate C-acetyltransferase [unclassified Enterococcus]MBS7577812.1 formate C-acetyltransferase [Enterococcus sp. MMGLQ5-2]MBS7585072.1 formate C-acetyltransferase [Enterococcus sp. MMGLQ5-1]NPD12928.1 formate C-acetyltransferase [Enterococcus sp. MMGLQ5-1]NPD37642.1 formate C-acetyltransferase [Enterococcus sp. MMGLQ5-2]